MVWLCEVWQKTALINLSGLMPFEVWDGQFAFSGILSKMLIKQLASEKPCRTCFTLCLLT